MGVNQSAYMRHDVSQNNSEPTPEECGNQAFSNRDYALAIENYNNVSPMTDAIRSRIIKVLDKMESSEQIRTLSRQITSTVTADVAFIVANAFHSSHEFSDAIRYAIDAVNFAPTKGIYRILLGRIYFDRAESTHNVDDYHTALEHFNVAYSSYTNLSNQNYAVVQMYRGLIFNRFGRYQQAIETLEDAYHNNSQTTTMLQILITLAYAYSKQSDYLSAIQHYDIILNSSQIILTDTERHFFGVLRNKERTNLVLQS